MGGSRRYGSLRFQPRQRLRFLIGRKSTNLRRDKVLRHPRYGLEELAVSHDDHALHLSMIASDELELSQPGKAFANIIRPASSPFAATKGSISWASRSKLAFSRAPLPARE